MKLFIISLLILCSALNNLYSTDSIIIWSKDYKLKRQDFNSLVKPKPDTVFNEANMNAAANCHLQVQLVNNNDKLLFQVIPFFNKNGSWIDSIVTGFLIEHEQIHFDITELVARKLRKSIEEFQNAGISDYNEYSLMINKYMVELDELNNRFDKMSDHSRDIYQQSNFVDFLSMELQKYESFSTDNYVQPNGWHPGSPGRSILHALCSMPFALCPLPFAHALPLIIIYS